MHDSPHVRRYGNASSGILRSQCRRVPDARDCVSAEEERGTGYEPVPGVHYATKNGVVDGEDEGVGGQGAGAEEDLHGEVG